MKVVVAVRTDNRDEHGRPVYHPVRQLDASRVGALASGVLPQPGDIIVAGDERYELLWREFGKELTLFVTPA